MQKLKSLLVVALILLISVSSLMFMSSCDKNIDDTSSTYSVDNNYFVFSGFKPTRVTNINLQTNASITVPYIQVLATCKYSLIEVSMNAKLYDKNNELIGSIEDSSNRHISAGTEINLHGEVSPLVQASTSSVVAIFSGTSNEKPDATKMNFVVTFVKNNNEGNIVENVEIGKTVSAPPAPRKANHIFSMWCTDFELTNEYDFSKSISSNLTLYAKYAVDYASLTNKITSGIMKSNVTVTTKSYNSFIGITTSSSSKSGSGIIFSQNSDDYYFLITNNHVAVKDSSYDKVSYTIEDYKGNLYKGYVKDMKSTYDLAVLYFKKGDETLNVIERADSDPKIGDEIVSIGQPQGQNNAISYGKVVSYPAGSKLTNCESYESNVTFNILQHSANTASGSSGGAILDVNLNLVGIHYAGSTTTAGDFLYGCAIPISKIELFLDTYIWAK